MKCLCFQDYRWWWRSFIVSGGSAVYVLFYSIFYFFTKLEITEFIPTLLYLSYTGKHMPSYLFDFFIMFFLFSQVSWCLHSGC